jgi:hypothetical protein
MGSVRLADIARTIRSKNAGVNQVTFDIIFASKKTYEDVKKSRAITRKSMADLFGIAVERISEFVEFDPANAIKFTILRSCPNGSPGDWDVLGCQYYAPLMSLTLDLQEETRLLEQPPKPHGARAKTHPGVPDR